MYDLNETSVDNVLLEIDLALQYAAKNRMVIYPWLVGETDAAGTYKGFDRSIFKKPFPNIICRSSPRSIQHIMKSLFKIQCKTMEGPLFTQPEINDIVSTLELEAWSKTSESPTALKVRGSRNENKNNIFDCV